MSDDLSHTEILLYAGEMTVEEWNELKHAAGEASKRLAEKKITLLCNACKQPVEDQIHVDFSSCPHKRQVICSNPGCRQIDYRYE